jgi:hypothetical protein
MMAFHRGDVSQLEKHLRRGPKLLERRFTLGEVYPSEGGCANDGRSGMHWTPIDGSTLLHLALGCGSRAEGGVRSPNAGTEEIVREREIFDWLLARGAVPNARAALDGDGFGGHTPLFNAIVCGPWPDTGRLDCESALV